MSLKNPIEIPKNATIGDVIKAVFPDWKIEHIRKMSGLDRYDINIDSFNRFSFYEDFWNSPYQPVKEAKCNRISESDDFTLTEEEKIICKMYLEDLDETGSCNEYKLLMKLIESAKTFSAADYENTEEKDAICTYQETGCGSCEHQIDCPLSEFTEEDDKEYE